MVHARRPHQWSGGRGEKGAFPKASYLLNQRDWDFLSTPQAQGRFTDSRRVLEALEASGQLQLVEGESVLAPEVTAILTPGHSPGSMGMVISSGGSGAIIIGDVIHHPALVTQPEWRVSFDADPQQAAATRSRVLDQVEADRMTMVAGHFPAPASAGSSVSGESATGGTLQTERLALTMRA